MSVIVDISKCGQETLETMNKDLNITITQKTKNNFKNQSNSYGKSVGKFVYLSPYRVQLNLAFIPFSYAIKKFNYKPQIHQSRNNFDFTGNLRPEQKQVRNEALELLNKQYSCVISTHVGFGKSILATYFMCKIRLKTLIIVNRLVLIQQWIEVLNRFIKEPKVFVIKPNQVIDWNYDFFIVNAINLPKIGYTPEIGLVVVDELHLIVSKVISTCFQYLTPNYMIGLSATPYRPDGLDVLINLYFGEERIDRQLYREHHVFVIKTNFTPHQKLVNGSVDWNDILTQQSLDEERNDLIIDTVMKIYQQRTGILILCKRVEQIKIFQDRFEKIFEKLENDVDVECLYGDRQPQPLLDSKVKKILIGTIQKVGTGFDAPYLDTLVIAADVEEYFIQYLGRVFRRQDTIPCIYDFVDNNNILQKHFNTRKKTYVKHGGVIMKK